jgi:hypothetical protein
LSVTFGLLLPPAAAQPKQKLPTAAEVLGKLKEKRDSGGVQVYKMEFEIAAHKSHDQVAANFREVRELQIDWKTGKFRLAGWKGWGDPFEQIEVYDGEKIKTQFRDVTKDGMPVGDGTWKYGMLTGRPNSWVFHRQYWPVFFNKGAIVGLHDQFYPTHYVFDPDPEKFFVDGEVTKDGRKCISLKTFPENPVGPMQYEYLIDPKKDYAVVGFLYTRKNAPADSLDIDVAEMKPGLWAPRGWTRTLYTGGQVFQVGKVKVTNFSEDVLIGENNQFDIVPPEGEKVGRSHYEWPEGKEDLTRTEYWYQVKNGKLVQIGGPPPPLWDRVVENWHWFALAGFAAAAFVGFRAWRGWGRGPLAPPAPPAGGG